MKTVNTLVEDIYALVKTKRVDKAVDAEAEIEKFGEAVSRTLLQHEIKSSVIQQESKSRPAPILKIGGIKNMYRLMVLNHPHLIDKNDLWTPFRKAVGIVSDNKHLTLEGMEELFRIKGLI